MSAGLDQAQISRVENGKRGLSLDQIEEIAKVLNINIIDLLNIDITKDNIISLLYYLDKRIGINITSNEVNGKNIPSISFKDASINEQIIKFQKYHMIQEDDNINLIKKLTMLDEYMKEDE